MNEVAIAMSLVEMACAELPHFGAGARITRARSADDGARGGHGPGDADTRCHAGTGTVRR